jgi:hypothetical protein
MLRVLLVLSFLASFGANCGASLLRSNIDPEAGEMTLPEERKLVEIVACPGGGPVNYFNVEIKLTPQGGFDTSSCTAWKKTLIGDDINKLLLDYGVGSAGQGDNAVFLADVCEMPVTTNRRKLGAIGFLWTGGGTCRSCSGDNRDKRHLQNYDPNWFRNIYAPSLANVLRNAIVQTVVGNHVDCLGNGPQVLVNIVQVSSSNQVSPGC